MAEEAVQMSLGHNGAPMVITPFFLHTPSSATLPTPFSVSQSIFDSLVASLEEVAKDSRKLPGALAFIRQRQLAKIGTHLGIPRAFLSDFVLSGYLRSTYRKPFAERRMSFSLR
ncbi:hypothetical protein CEXT_149021 [Caerostris extrusa]|uniref:Uncharacterized protein n=1 Tax=Caerostris extrusa TaxID=172846 RepID=A0AAV4Y718_CAEEX|nr:hypothetical protein CEXT_149021 [Caerostris extrusa]